MCRPSRSRSRSQSQAESDSSDEDDHCEFIDLQNGLMGIPHGQILVPEALILKVLQRFYDSPYAGHLGMQQVYRMDTPKLSVAKNDKNDCKEMWNLC